MPSIAQQDHLRIRIETFSDPTSDEIAAIKKAVKQGVIFDVIIEQPDGVLSRVSAYDATSLYFINPNSGDVQYITYNTQL